MTDQDTQQGYCFTCGSHEDLSRRACRNCGTALDTIDSASRTKFCIACGNGLAGNWKHCIRCGAEASDETAAEHYRHQTISKRPDPAGGVSGAAEDGVELISRGWDNAVEPAQPSPASAAAGPGPATSGVIDAIDIVEVAPAEDDDAAVDIERTRPPSVPFESPSFRRSLPTSSQETGDEDRVLRPHAFTDPGLPAHTTQLVLLVAAILTFLRTIGVSRFANSVPNRSLYNATTVPLTAAVIASLLALMWWTWTTASNLESLGRENLERGQAFAAWAWVVPVMQVPWTRQVINRLWTAAEPDSWSSVPWEQRDGNAAIDVAWVSLIAAGVLIGAPTLFSGLADLNSTVNRLVQTLGLVALSVALLAFVRCVGGVTQRHQDRIRGTLR